MRACPRESPRRAEFLLPVAFDERRSFIYCMTDQIARPFSVERSDYFFRIQCIAATFHETFSGNALKRNSATVAEALFFSRISAPAPLFKRAEDFLKNTQFFFSNLLTNTLIFSTIFSYTETYRSGHNGHDSKS